MQPGGSLLLEPKAPVFAPLNGPPPVPPVPRLPKVLVVPAVGVFSPEFLLPKEGAAAPGVLGAGVPALDPMFSPPCPWANAVFLSVGMPIRGKNTESKKVRRFAVRVKRG